MDTIARRLGARQAISSLRFFVSGQNFAGTVLPMPMVSILPAATPLDTRYFLTFSARFSDSFWLYWWLPRRSVCPSITTASRGAQPGSLPNTSLSRRAFAAAFTSALLNANSWSFWSVTTASQRLGAAAAGLAAGFGFGAGAAGFGFAAGAAGL